MGDVWKLETPDEESASIDLALLAERALKWTTPRAYLEELWGEPWLNIKAKLQTEGSCWYVWWMDGVRRHLANLQRGDVGTDRT